MKHDPKDKIRRYDVEPIDETHFAMRTDENGAWCEYSDVTQLREENEKLRRALLNVMDECSAPAKEYALNRCWWHAERALNLRPSTSKKPARHVWDRDGERCVNCGDKDWMGGPCSKPSASDVERAE